MQYIDESARMATSTFLSKLKDMQILLSWSSWLGESMMVTPSTLRGRVTISFSLNKDMYSGYFVYLSYICNAYQIEGIYLHLPFQNEGHAQNLLSIEGGPSSSSVGKAWWSPLPLWGGGLLSPLLWGTHVLCTLFTSRMYVIYIYIYIYIYTYVNIDN